MTSEHDKEKIRPIYSCLQGCLSQAPDNNKYPIIQSSSVWKLVNEKIDKLNNISGEDYNGFKLVPQRNEKFRGEFVATDTYRTTLGGLISELHGKYFPKEIPPFSGMPSTVISQTQQQNQAVHVQMLLEIQSKIDQKLSDYDEGMKEKTFLKKVKSLLSSIKDATGLIALLMNTAKEYGLSVDDLKNIFS